MIENMDDTQLNQRQDSLSSNFIVRHWRGDYSLARSYWLHATLLVGLLAFIGSIVLQFFSGNAGLLRLYAGVSFIFWPVVIVSWIWGVVGTWRSASRHVERGGKAIWSALTQFTIILGTFSTLGQVVTNGIPQMIEHAQIAVGRDPLGQAAMVRLSSTGKSIEIVGPLAQGSAEQFIRLLNNVNFIDTVVLNSNGGRIVEAQSIAEHVRMKQLNVYVEEKCESACTLILISGKDRAATPNATIGFHQPYFPGLDDQARLAAIQSNRELYQRAGIAGEFIDRAMATAPGQMWRPTHAEMLQAGVLTRTSLGGETATNFSKVKSAAELSRLLLETSLFRTLQETRPALFDFVVNSAWKSRSAGRNDNDILSSARSALSAELPSIISNTDDDLLMEYFSLILEQTRAARSVSYDACARFMTGQLNIAQALPSSLSTREAALLERALRQNQTRTRDLALASRGYQIISRSLSTADLATLTTPDRASAKQRCDSTISFYSAIIKIPRAEQVAVIRGIFSAD